MAEQIVNEFTVNRPIEEAWPIICDVERITVNTLTICSAMPQGPP